jgi:hypothetical protein
MYMRHAIGRIRRSSLRTSARSRAGSGDVAVPSGCTVSSTDAPTFSRSNFSERPTDDMVVDTAQKCMDAPNFAPTEFEGLR